MSFIRGKELSMTEQFKAATIRALYGALLTAALTFLTTFQVTAFDEPRRLEIAAVAAGVAFFGYMLSRGVAEGVIDSNRGPTPADVGYSKR
jgi:hypothetical protein